MPVDVKDAGGVTRTIATIDDLEAIVGARTDARSTATDATSVSEVAVLKEVSFAVQAAAASLAALVASIGSPGQVAMTASVPVAVANDQSPIPTKDAGPNWTSVWGVAGVPVTTATTFSTAAVTDAPTSGQKICVDDIIVSTDAATTITLLEETSGTVMFGPWYLPANSGPLQISVRGKKKLATANKKLVATSVGAAHVTVQVGYHSEV